ncbi:response regulator [Aggregatilinea lenta]|uniref:response regulator n=1 Tax=Aggregatilinea lenta TaxID=913108 RepID=UPI000E5BFC49|nr:response regulator [Aggregatilinea lenta]
MRVLYVEDNEMNQALVGRVMRGRQHAVTFREDGEGALDVLAGDPEIDLVLLDIELAGTMNGLDVVKILRDRGDMRPVVAVTAYAMMGDRERIMASGCDQYLPKPLVILDLIALLDHYAEERANVTDAPAASTAKETSAPAPASAAAETNRVAPEPTAAVQPAPAQPEAVPQPVMAAVPASSNGTASTSASGVTADTAGPGQEAVSPPGATIS